MVSLSKWIATSVMLVWDLPRLVHRCRTADRAIGSRYAPGGGTENWNAKRRFVSRCGNTYVSLFLGSTIHDRTGGFCCYRHELLARLNFATVQTKGDIFQVELAWWAVQLGADVVELLICFCDRIEGHSKLGWPSIAEALAEVPKNRTSTMLPTVANTETHESSTIS